MRPRQLHGSATASSPPLLIEKAHRRPVGRPVPARRERWHTEQRPPPGTIEATAPHDHPNRNSSNVSSGSAPVDRSPGFDEFLDRDTDIHQRVRQLELLANLPAPTPDPLVCDEFANGFA